MEPYYKEKAQQDADFQKYTGRRFENVVPKEKVLIGDVYYPANQILTYLALRDFNITQYLSDTADKFELTQPIAFTSRWLYFWEPEIFKPVNNSTYNQIHAQYLQIETPPIEFIEPYVCDLGSVIILTTLVPMLENN